MELGCPQEAAFPTKKDALISAAVLAFRDLSEPLIHHMDTGDCATGATLSQERDDDLHLLAYRNKKLSPVKKNYSTYELSAFVVSSG
jgi:hypothetical protein